MVLVGYWPLNESSKDSDAPTAKDYSGKENHGTINDGVDSTVPGAQGVLGQNAYSFDGSNDYVDLPQADVLPSGNQKYTISVWFKASSDHIGGLIGWGNWGTTNEVNALRLRSSGDSSQISFRHYWWGNDLDADTSVPYESIFHNVIAKFDGTERSIWLEGEKIASDEPTGHDAKIQDVNIGVTNSSEYLDGDIAEVRVYNHALTPAEIQYLYQVGKRGRQVTSSKSS
jgi:hypothetical protein